MGTEFIGSATPDKEEWVLLEALDLLTTPGGNPNECARLSEMGFGPISWKYIKTLIGRGYVEEPATDLFCLTDSGVAALARRRLEREESKEERDPFDVFDQSVERGMRKPRLAPKKSFPSDKTKWGKKL